MIRKFVFYLVFLLFVTLSLQQVGFDLSILLGTAGFLTIAIGFASKTVVSNFISGIFIIAEGSISIGDKVQIGKNKGELVSIDLLSVKIKNSNQQHMRISNESVLKSEIINLSQPTVQRRTIIFQLSVLSDIENFIRKLASIIEKSDLVEKEYRPKFLIKNMQDSSLFVECKIWCKVKDDDEAISHILKEMRYLYKDSQDLLPFNNYVVSKKM
ncbi:MAG: mechanosensitive ion channel [Legionellales bacterium]|nr:mechanosensitive ion channel [Legionellales bacterium]